MARVRTVYRNREGQIPDNNPTATADVPAPSEKPLGEQITALEQAIAEETEKQRILRNRESLEEAAPPKSTTTALMEQIESLRKAEAAAAAQSQQPMTVEQYIDTLPMPPHARAWLKQGDRPKYVMDANENAKMSALHQQLQDEGLQPYSPEYFQQVETRLGLAAPAEDGVEEFEGPNSRIRVGPKRRVVSGPSNNSMGSIVENYFGGGGDYDFKLGKITLTAEQKQAARISNISEAEYAVQLMRLREEQENDPARYGSR